METNTRCFLMRAFLPSYTDGDSRICQISNHSQKHRCPLQYEPICVDSPLDLTEWSNRTHDNETNVNGLQLLIWRSPQLQSDKCNQGGDSTKSI